MLNFFKNFFMKQNLGLILIMLLFFGCQEKPSENKNLDNPTDETVATTPRKNQASVAAKGVTASGYPYKLHVQNKGLRPIVGDEVVYHQLLLKNDSVVRSTYLGFEPVKAVLPAKGDVADPPPPSYEGLFLMSINDSITLLQPMDSVKGYQRPRWLKKSDTLKYSLKLLNIRRKEIVEAERDSLKGIELIMIGTTQQWIKDFQAGKLENLTKMDSGLSYILHEEGTGKEAAIKKYIQLHYAGFKMDGTILDNTYSRNQPVPYRVGNKGIPGWDELLPKLKEGGKATVFVPSELAYGAKGREPKVGPNEDLVFYLEVVKVN